MASFPGGALRQISVLLEPEVARGVAEGTLQLEVMTRQAGTGLWDRRVPQITLPEVSEAAVQALARAKRNALPITFVVAAVGLVVGVTAVLLRRGRSTAADTEPQVLINEDALPDGTQDAEIVRFPSPVDDDRQPGSRVS